MFFYQEVCIKSQYHMVIWQKYTDYGYIPNEGINQICKFGPAVPKNLGVGLDFRPFCEGDFFSIRLSPCKIYCQKNTFFSSTFSIEFTQPAIKLPKFDRPQISYISIHLSLLIKKSREDRPIGYIFTSAENASLEVNLKVKNLKFCYL